MMIYSVRRLLLNYRLRRCVISTPFITGPRKVRYWKDLHDEHNFSHLLPCYAEGKVNSTNWILRLEHKIKLNSVITVFSAVGPLFHEVKAIIIYDNDFKIITKLLYNCFFIGHLLAYKIFDNNSYSYALLNMHEITYNTPIIVKNKLADGYNYIAKHWM